MASPGAARGRFCALSVLPGLSAHPAAPSGLSPSVVNRDVAPPAGPGAGQILPQIWWIGSSPSCHTDNTSSPSIAKETPPVISNPLPCRTSAPQSSLRAPFPAGCSALRFPLAMEKGFFTKMLNAFLQTVFTWQRKRGRRLGIKNGQTGAISFLQRATALTIHPHTHTLVLRCRHQDLEAPVPLKRVRQFRPSEAHQLAQQKHKPSAPHANNARPRALTLQAPPKEPPRSRYHPNPLRSRYLTPDGISL
jgi:hypothetical protein